GDILMKDMMHGKHYLAEKMKELAKTGSRTIVFDCVTQEDLDLIADALITSKLKFVAVDPGAFTASFARKIMVPFEKRETKKILAVVGSVNPITKKQMEELWLSQRTYNVFVHTTELLEGAQRRETEIQRVIDDILVNCNFYTVSTVTGDGIMPENRIEFEYYKKKYHCTADDISNMINTAFSEIAYQIFKKNNSFQGLYTSGGDITVAVCRRFATAGLCLLDEVLPLAAYGKFVKGELDGIHIVTKGGMVGENNAINQCITYLKQKLYL
ncbi:MAG: nucleotide-binding domain containing protein, partial [Lachnospiraceae bacterium]